MHVAKRSDSFRGAARAAFEQLEALVRSSPSWEDDVARILTKEMPMLRVSSEENGSMDAFEVVIDFDGNLRLREPNRDGYPRVAPEGVRRILAFIEENYEGSFRGHGGWDS